MRIKQHFLLFILPAISVLCFAVTPLAFAELETVEEEELARMNVSVSGAPVATVDAGASEDESLIKTADTRIDKTEIDLTASMLFPKTPTESTIHKQSLSSQAESRTFVGGIQGTYTGGIITVTPR